MRDPDDNTIDDVVHGELVVVDVVADVLHAHGGFEELVWRVLGGERLKKKLMLLVNDIGHHIGAWRKSAIHQLDGMRSAVGSVILMYYSMSGSILDTIV